MSGFSCPLSQSSPSSIGVAKWSASPGASLWGLELQGEEALSAFRGMILPEMSTSAQDKDAVGGSHPPWLVTCWRLWALALPSVLGLMGNAGFLFPLVCAAWGAVLTTCCFSSLWQQHPYPGVPQSLCEEAGLHESEEDRSLKKVWMPPGSICSADGSIQLNIERRQAQSCLRECPLLTYFVSCIKVVF